MAADGVELERARRRPRVLRIITRLAVSGVSTHVTLANQLLTRRGWETLLVHGRVQPDELEIDLPIADVATQRIDSLARPVAPISDMRAAASLLGVVRTFRPDIIHTHHSKAGLLGRSVAMVADIPRVHTFHGHVFEGYFGPRTSMAIVTAERLLAGRTSRLIALSPLQRDDLLSRGIGRPDRFEIVPLGLDLERFRAVDRGEARSRLGLPPNAIIVVMVGRLVPIKRVDRLVRVFANLYGRRPDAHLYVIGDGSERAAAEDQAVAAGVGDAITFCGWRSDTATWYAAADFVVLSSDNEGTPLALIEAAAAGRPAVATSVGGVADVVIDGVTGLLAPAIDEGALTDAMCRLADDPRLRARLGAAAPAAADRFGIGRLVDDLERIYCDLLASPRAR
jgi:glycosyltransferase involved in cell wall biosynthesis